MIDLSPICLTCGRLITGRHFQFRHFKCWLKAWKCLFGKHDFYEYEEYSTLEQPQAFIVKTCLLCGKTVFQDDEEILKYANKTDEISEWPE